MFESTANDPSLDPWREKLSNTKIKPIQCNNCIILNNTYFLLLYLLFLSSFPHILPTKLSRTLRTRQEGSLFSDCQTEPQRTCFSVCDPLCLLSESYSWELNRGKGPIFYTRLSFVLSRLYPLFLKRKSLRFSTHMHLCHLFTIMTGWLHRLTLLSWCLSSTPPHEP